MKKIAIPLRKTLCAVLLIIPLTQPTSFAAPPGGSGGGSAGGGQGSGQGGGSGGGASGAPGGPPTTPSGFFSQTSTNYARPSNEGWGNWFKTLDPPWDESAKNVLLCYTVQATHDASIPYLFTRVSEFRTSAGATSPFACSSQKVERKKQPLLHGDRLRVAIDIGDANVADFLKNVSVINLNVTLTVAPPLQPTLLRSNIGASVTTSGLGGSVAGDALNDPDNARRCKDLIPAFASSGLNGTNGPDPGKSCEDLGANIDAVARAYGVLNNANKTVNAINETNTRANPPAPALDSDTTQGKEQQDAKALLTTALKNSHFSPIAKQAVLDPSQLTPRDSVIVLSWRYALPGDVIPTVSISALYTTPANAERWVRQQFYPTGKIVACPAEDLCVASATRGSSQSGDKEPRWPGPKNVRDGDLTWAAISAFVSQAAPGTRPAAAETPTYHPDDHVVWSPAQGQQIESIVQAWQPGARHDVNEVVVVEVPGQGAGTVSRLFAVVDATGDKKSADQSPRSWVDPVLEDNGQILWKYDAKSAGPDWTDWPRWTARHIYSVNDGIRCEQDSQKANVCVANNSGFSGLVEPWWPHAGANAPAAQAPAAYLRDNQILWSPFTPSSSLAASNQVVNLVTEELTQVHAPSIFGVSTALLRTKSAIASAYTFATQPTATCPSSSVDKITGKPDVVNCTATEASSARSTDIALLVSPYVFHHINATWFDHSAVDGIDAETPWAWNNYENWIPEPFIGFGLNSIGNSYYAGLSFEILVRNFQVILGEAWLKGPLVERPTMSTGTASTTFTPVTYTGLTHSLFIGVAFNVSGLITGH